MSGGRQTSSTKRYGAFEEYWYDAFGRRIFKLSRQESPVCTIASRCKTSADRYVWDGDQLLYEVRRNSVSETISRAIRCTCTRGRWTNRSV